MAKTTAETKPASKPKPTPKPQGPTFAGRPTY